MLDRDRGEVRVCGQVRRNTGGIEKPPENFEMPRTGIEHLDEWLVEPRADMVKCLRRVERIDEDSRMSHQTDESANDSPRNPDGLGTVEQSLPPRSRFGVTRSMQVVRVDEKVDVREDHGPPRVSRVKSSMSS